MSDPAGAATQSEGDPADPDDAAERLPAEIAAEVLRKYFSLTRADLDQVERCRGPANKLGFSVQLCTLRWRGHFLADTRAVPAAVLQAVAPQLGLLPMPIADYPQDEKTRFAHLERIRQHLGFVRCDRAQRERLLTHLTTVACSAPRTEALRKAAQAWLLAQRIVRPGRTTLRDLVATAREAGLQQTYDALTHALTGAQCSQLDGLLTTVETPSDPARLPNELVGDEPEAAARSLLRVRPRRHAARGATGR